MQMMQKGPNRQKFVANYRRWLRPGAGVTLSWALSPAWLLAKLPPQHIFAPWIFPCHLHFIFIFISPYFSIAGSFLSEQPHKNSMNTFFSPVGLLQGWHHLASRGGRRMTTILLFHRRCSHWHERIFSAWAGNCRDRLSVILQPRSGAGSPAPLSGEFLCSLHKAGQPQRKRWSPSLWKAPGRILLAAAGFPSLGHGQNLKSHRSPIAAVGRGWG